MCESCDGAYRPFASILSLLSTLKVADVEPYGPARFLLSNLSPRMSTHHSYLPSFAVSPPQGASGQAVQNFNVMFGYPETTGLLSPPMFP